MLCEFGSIPYSRLCESANVLEEVEHVSVVMERVPKG